MTETLKTFQPVVQKLLCTTSSNDEVSVASELADLFTSLLDRLVNNKGHNNTTDTRLDGGIALSSKHALDCLQDPLRTVRFIKGTYQAIRDMTQAFPKKKIELVYAGCGPGAPIIIPLLSLFTPSQLSITLIDINKTSIDAIKLLIEALGVSAYFRNISLSDAILYKHPDNTPLHIVISETMDKGLSKEPQVRITQNLAPQLDEGGVLIPQSIDLYAEHSFHSNEPYFDIYKNVLALGPEIETNDRQLLFSVTKEISNEGPFVFTSDVIDVPDNFKTVPDIVLFAEITIYKNERLFKAESLISNPFCVQSLYNVKSKQYTLEYITQGIPSWNLHETVLTS